MSRSFPRLRTDLQIARRADGNFLVTDPVSEQYFLFSEIELSLAHWLQRAGSVQQWCDGWNQENRTQQLSPTAAESFLLRLMNDQLVTVSRNTEGERLHQLHQRSNDQRWSARLKNPLAIRLPGIDPTPVLKYLSPVLGWLFRPAMMVASLLILFCVAMVVIFAGVQQAPHLPSIQWLLSPAGIAGMLLVFVGVKIIHELGHAIAAMTYGANCKQIGVMLLFFMPTLYCDVSAAWRLERKTDRIAISAAGVYVELMICLLAAISWALSSPGIVNTVSFQLMALCGVGSVLINGNPLMRYDGYYVLSDLLNRPNLSLSARQELGQFSSTLVSRDWFSRDWTLIVYGMLAAAYRWVVLAAVVIAIICFTNENSISVVGWSLAVGVLLPVVGGVVKSNQRRRSQVSVEANHEGAIGFAKFLVSKATMPIAVVALVWFVCCVRLPHWVYMDVQVQPVKTQTLFATTSGFVDAANIQIGDVAANQTILTLDDPELTHQCSIAEIEAKRAANQIEQLRRQARQLPELNETLAAVTEQAKAKQVRFEQLREQLQSLALVSSMEGRVESLLVQRNPGNDKTVQQINVGQPIARVVDDSKKQIRLLVDEDTVDLLEAGQVVRCCFDRLPNRVHSGAVGEILIGDSVAKESTAGDDAGKLGSRSKRYLISVQTNLLPPELGVFSGGRARVKIRPSTLLSRLNQQLQHTFQYR